MYCAWCFRTYVSRADDSPQNCCSNVPLISSVYGVFRFGFTVSLLPPFHVALVRSEDLHERFIDFVTARADALAQSSNCTFVTGPSRTADIELSLTIGVHGPGRVAIVIGP